MTVANVVRLAALARRDEIEIMQLVGAPFAYIRGPFIAEGLLQGGMGARFAVVLLLATFAAIRARYGAFMSDAVGLTGRGVRANPAATAARGRGDGARLPRRFHRGARRPLSYDIR